ncbi:MAG: hypothetical protein FVQ80_08240 [Planctomycetes bacterium]|nr:hypothetical protein [Planctomycetota bacterium]
MVAHLTANVTALLVVGITNLVVILGAIFKILYDQKGEITELKNKDENKELGKKYEELVKELRVRNNPGGAKYHNNHGREDTSYMTIEEHRSRTRERRQKKIQKW